MYSYNHFLLKQVSDKPNLLQMTKNLVASYKHAHTTEKDLKLTCFDRGHFTKLSYSKNSSRHYDAVNIVDSLVETIGQAMWPSFSQDERFNTFVDIIDGLVAKRGRGKIGECRESYQKIGKELCTWLSKKKKPAERRPMSSIIRKSGVKLKEARNLIKPQRITEREWSNIGKHVKYPGPGEPISSCHPNRSIAIDFGASNTAMNILQDESMLEDTAYGVKHVKDCMGRLTEVESIKRTDNKENMWRRYVKKFVSLMPPEKGDGKCKYHPQLCIFYNVVFRPLSHILYFRS